MHTLRGNKINVSEEYFGLFHPKEKFTHWRAAIKSGIWMPDSGFRVLVLPRTDTPRGAIYTALIVGFMLDFLHKIPGVFIEFSETRN